MKISRCPLPYLFYGLYFMRYYTISKYLQLNQSSACDCVCGIRKSDNHYARIVGGTESYPHDQPWMAGLWKHERLYCGATVISQKVLLTAAHCIYSFSPSEIFVYLGGHRVIRNDIVRQMKGVSSLLSHEYFNVVSFDNDIGLIRLENWIFYGPTIQPACLPNLDSADYSGKTGIVMGWGKLGENGRESSVLQYVKVPIWPQNRCFNSGYGRKRLTNNMMCAGYQNGRIDACRGDSGGPMLSEPSLLASTEVIGIISWGRGCARPNFPGIYTKVINYKSWLYKVLTNECFCKRKGSISYQK